MGPVPSRSVDIEEVVVSHVGDICDGEDCFPVGSGCGGIEAGDHVIPCDLVALGNIVISFKLKHIPFVVGVITVKRLKEGFTEALHHIVEALEFSIHVKTVIDAKTGPISHLVAEAAEEFIDDEGITDVIFSGADAEALVVIDRSSWAVEWEIH